MVGDNRTEAKEAFSRAFDKALDRIEFEPKPGRIRALAKRLEVSYEAARKWLGGEAVPDQTNMLRIQRELKIDASELRIDADPESREFGQDSFSRKLTSMWPALSDEVRGQIIGFALVQATTRPAPPKKRRLPGRTNGELTPWEMLELLEEI